MTTHAPVWSVERHDRVGSTMDVAAERAAAGAAEGTVIVADHQTAGRGRAGRAWTSPPGAALLMTAVLRPDLPAERLAALALVAGVALAEAVEAETGLACWLKWPNDLWLGDRLAGSKTAGILLSARSGRSGVEHVLLGLGLNVSTPAPLLPEGATSIAAALERAGRSLVGRQDGDVGGDPRDRFLARSLDRLGVGYRAFVATGGQPPLDAWLQRAALLGERVEVVDGDRPRRGVFVGLRADGALLLRNERGDDEAIVAGEVVRGPRYRSESAAEGSGRCSWRAVTYCSGASVGGCRKRSSAIQTVRE